MAEKTPELRTFLEDPSKFDQIAAEYDSKVECYRDLQNNAKRSLESFDEYHNFLTDATQHGPTNFVFDRLNRNAVRSLKNMVLGSSRAGRQFPIFTVGELQDRIEAYRELGVDKRKLESTGVTILEHMFDNRSQRQQYELLNSLLNQETLPRTEIVSVFVRARFVLSLYLNRHNETSLENHIDRLIADLPDPLPDDDRDGESLLNAAIESPYGDPKKLTLAQASLVRSSNREALIKYLYFTALDVPERYRHKSQYQPWRGELQLAKLQFHVLLDEFSDSLSDDRIDRCQSYRHLVAGAIRSGGRWDSSRDPGNLPEADFKEAAVEYYNASNTIRSVDRERQVKYLSKAFRHQATSARCQSNESRLGWDTSRSIHERATDVLTDINQNIDTGTDLDRTVIELISVHQLYYHRASAVVAFQHADVESMSDHIDSMWKILKNGVEVYVDTSLMEDLNHLRDGLRLEVKNEFGAAHKEYKEFNHSAIDIKQRRVLTLLKQYLQKGDYDSALSEAEPEFAQDSPIRYALSILNGNAVYIDSFESPILPELVGTSPVEKLTFSNITQLVANASDNNDTLLTALENQLLNL